MIKGRKYVLISSDRKFYYHDKDGDFMYLLRASAGWMNRAGRDSASYIELTGLIKGTESTVFFKNGDIQKSA